MVVDHGPKPWTADEFDELPDWDLNRSGVEDVLGEDLRAPQCECLQCAQSRFLSQVQEVTKFSDYDDIKPKEKEELSDHQYMLFSSHMYAFMLQDRTYGMSCGRSPHRITGQDSRMLTLLTLSDIVEVEGLRDPTIVEDAISRLVMDEANKGVIKAIARTYTESRSTSRFNADFIHGKGEGQILLLHGPPGTGKTLTAGA